MTRIIALAQAFYRLEGLGPVQLTGPGREPIGLRTRKQLALVFYLARRGKPVNRGELIDLLWSEDPEKRARHSLSQSCSLINKLFGSEVIRTAGRDRLAVEAGALALDVDEFERLMEDGAHDEAIELWRGTLFEGVWIDRAPRFERWLAEEREKLQRSFRRAMHTRIESLRSSGDLPAIRKEAERLLQYDPLDERAMLAWLEALTLSGDRSLALRRYGEFEQIIRRELDAEPGSALRAWAKRVRKSEVPPARERAPAPRISEITVLPAVQPFFGRTEEFGMLWKAWETAGMGSGAFIIIEGEAGIGKTALATKLVNQAHVAGGSVCFVKCYRTEKSVPFAPITALIRQLSRLPGFVALDPIWIGELTRLVPELRERFANAPQPMALDDAARHRLSDATLEATRAVSDEQELMIVLDDLMYADEASLALLHYVGRHATHQAMLLLGISRLNAEAGAEAAFLETARASSPTSFLRLPTLEPAIVRRLVSQVLAAHGMSAADGMVDDVAKHAGGNPLQAIEMAMSFHQRPLGSFAKDVPSRGDVFGRSAGYRLESLHEDHRQVASAIAVAGRPLAEYELSSVTDLRTADLASAVEGLEVSGFVRRVGPSVMLSHERYASVALGLLSSDGKATLHLRMARLLKPTAARNPAARFEVAHHYAEAGHFKEAVSNALRAARHANQIGAIRSKAEALELAWRVDETFNPSVAADLADCYLNLNDADRLSAFCGDLRQRGDLDKSFMNTIAYLETAAGVKSGALTMSAAQEALQQLLVSPPLAFAFELDAQLLLIQVADKTGNVGLARSVARQLRATHGSTSPHALFAAGYVFAKYYWPSRALPLFEEAVRQSQRNGLVSLEQLARDCVGITLKMVGRFKDSYDHFERAHALARKTMDSVSVSRSLQNRAVTEISLGMLEVARQTLRETDGVNTSGWGYAVYNDYNFGIIEYLEGNYQKATSHFQACQIGAQKGQNLLLAGDACAGRALSLLKAGRTEEMTRAMDEYHRIDQSGETERVGWIRHAAKAWSCWIETGDAEKATGLIERASRQLARRDVASWLTLELECVWLRERSARAECPSARCDLIESANRYGARFIEIALTNPSANSKSFSNRAWAPGPSCEPPGNRVSG